MYRRKKSLTSRRGKPMLAMAIVLAGVPGLVFVENGQAQNVGHDQQRNETMSEQESSQQVGKKYYWVRLNVKGEPVVLRLDDNPTSRDLVEQLPLELGLSDHASTEKIAYLPKKLDTAGTPPGYDPSPADVTYYAPWGNLAIFYRDFGFARGLVRLGVVEAGLASLSAISGEVTVVVERIDRP